MIIQKLKDMRDEASRVIQMSMRPLVQREYEDIPSLKVKTIDAQTNSVFIPDVLVGLESDYPAHPWALIGKECMKHECEIYLETPRVNRQNASGTDLLNLLILELARDTLVDLTVKGRNIKEIQEAAFRIYCGITTREKVPDFERLERKSQVAVYWHGHPELADVMKNVIEKHGIKATAYERCLCELTDNVGIEEPVVLIYPDKRSDCPAICSQVMDKNPATKFYTLPQLDCCGWREKMGKHRNLAHVGEPKVFQYFADNIHSIVNQEILELRV